MRKRKQSGLDFEIDTLSQNSIVNAISGDSFQTDISIVTAEDLKNYY